MRDGDESRRPASTMDRRELLARGVRGAAGLAVLGGGSGLLAACGSSSPGAGGGAQTSGNAGVSSARPKRGGSVVIGVGSEVDGFDPTQSRFDTSGLMYAYTVFDPLVSLASDGSYEPYLAESITPNHDYTTWTIKARPNVTFHDGTPFDADALKLNLDLQVASPLTGIALKNVDSVAKVDASTVAVKMKSPWVPFPFYLCGIYPGSQLGFMAAPSMLKSKDGARNPVGTGPYVFRQWVPNDHFTAERNPHYWRAGLPYLDQVTYKPIVDQSAQENSLRAGNIDLLTTGYTQIISDFRSSSTISMADDSKSTVGQPNCDFIMLNTAVPPLDDIRVRKALAQSLNQRRNIDVIDNGIEAAVDGPFPSGPFHSSTGYPSYDPSAAKKLLAAYERDKGKVSFQQSATNSSTIVSQAQLLQQMWKTIGATTSITQVQTADLITNALLGKFQAVNWTQFAAPDPDLNYLWWSSDTAAPVGQLSTNFARNKDPKIDAALATGRTNPDKAARVEAYQTVASRLGADIPYLWMDRAIDAVLARPQVRNFNSWTLPDGSRGVATQGGWFPILDIWVQH